MLYFSGEDKANIGKHCVGIATSDRVTGPFMPEAAPLACQIE